MKTTTPWVPPTLPVLVWLLALFLGRGPAEAATLGDFGYNTMRMEGVPAAGARPLVLVLVDFATAQQLL